MELFIDTANISQIKDLYQSELISGVTTNPSLMANEGIKGLEKCYKHYIDICQIVNGPISAEVLSIDAEGMLNEGLALAALHPNIVVKIPMTQAGIKTIHILTKKEIRTNCTLVFSAAQALLAAKAGATYVSPFIGRLDDIGENGLELIKSIRTIYNNYKYSTKILAASIRTNAHIINCAELGADVATIPYSTIEMMFEHKLTTKGLNQFMIDAAKLEN
jgi:transaldolase